jgi:LytS/YehU family sensor histidine kinase
MIPFVENSFEHDSSKLLTNPRVELSMPMEGNQLIFTLKNNKPGTNTQKNHSIEKEGIDLKNTAKKLELLYPGKHNLEIIFTDTSFSCCVKYNASGNERSKPRHFPVSPPQSTLLYANP